MTRFCQQIICPFQPNVKKTQSITKQPITTTHSVFTHTVTQQKTWNIYLVLCFTKLYARHVHGFLCRIIVYYLILNTSSLPIFNMRSASFSLIRFQHRQGYNTNQAANKIYCHSLQLDKIQLLSLVLGYDTKQNPIYIYTHKQRDAVKLQHCHYKQLRSCRGIYLKSL